MKEPWWGRFKKVPRLEVEVKESQIDLFASILHIYVTIMTAMTLMTINHIIFNEDESITSRICLID